MKRSILVTIALLPAACGPLPQPTLHPHTALIPHRGINLGPERVTPFYLNFLARYQQPLTLRVPVHSAEEARAVLAAVPPYPDLSVLVLIEKPDLALVAALVPVWTSQLTGVELGNELDLAGLTPVQFGAFVLAGYQALRAGGFQSDVISGGIYTVDMDTLAYLRAGSANWPTDIVAGLHFYGDSSDNVLAAVQQLGRAVAVTEYGIPARTPQEQIGQLVYLQEKEQAFTRLGATYALIYQLVSGPSTSNLDNFGLLDFMNVPKEAAFWIWK